MWTTSLILQYCKAQIKRIIMSRMYIHFFTSWYKCRCDKWKNFHLCQYLVLGKIHFNFWGYDQFRMQDWIHSHLFCALYNIAGFLRPGLQPSVISNFGLLDQVAAIHWLKENIKQFRGDPNSITLVGHGTGAAMVSLLLTSPVAQASEGMLY